MSVLKELELYGFRSFNPNCDSKQKLVFKTPITLLLGDNGCGKSTIIEVLKFITSGVYPTGSKQGNYFIHYPKFQNKNQVSASAVLKFTDFEGNTVVVNKAVSRKTTTDLQSKCSQNPSSITITSSNGNQKTISGRIVEVEDETCKRLGVSKSVLENVIFCQQDDSNWPLDEAKRLKEKFDAIFSTTVYNNLLEKVRTYLREYNERMKRDEYKLRNLLDIYHDFENKLSELKKKEVNKDKLQSDLKHFNGEIDKRVNDIKKLKEIKSEVDHLNEIILRNDALMNNLQKRATNMKEFTKMTFEGTDEELESEINKLRTLITPNINNSEHYKKEKEDLIILEKNLGNNINKMEREYAKLLAEKIHFEKLENELKVAIDKFQSEFHDDSKQLPEIEVNVIRLFLKEFQAAYNEKEYQIKKTDRNYQKQLDQLKLDVAKLEQSISMKKNQIKTNENNQAKFKELVANKQSSSNSKDELDKINKKINEIQKEIDLKNEQLDDRSLRIKLDLLLKNKTEFEMDLKTIRKHVVLFEKLNNKEEICNDLIDNQKVFWDKYGAFLQKIKWNKKDSLTKFLNNCESKYYKNMENKKKDSNDLKTKLTIFGNEKKNIEEQLSKLNDQETKLKAEIVEKWNNSEKNIENEIMNCRINIDEIQKKISIFAATKTLHESYIVTFENIGEINCPTCEQMLSSDQMKKKIAKNLRNNIIEIPKKMENLENKLLTEENNLKTMIIIQEKIQEYDNLIKKEIPNAEKKLLENNNLLEEIQKKYNNFENSLSEPEKEYRMLTSILKESNMYDLNSKKISDLQNDINDIKSQIYKIYKRSNLEKLIDEQRNVELKIELISKESDEIREQLTKHNDERFELQNKLKHFIQKEQEIEKNNRELILFEDLIKLRDILEIEVNKLENELTIKNKELKKLKIEYDNFNDNIRNEFNEKHTKKISTENALRSILRLLENIEDCSKTYVNFESVKQELDNLREEKQIIVSRLRDVEDRIKNIHSESLTSEVRLHQLEDQLRLRDIYYEINIIKEKIEETTRKLNDLNLDNIIESLETLQIEMDNLKQRKYKVMGSLNHTDESLKLIKEELKKPKFKDIQQELRKIKIQIVLNKNEIEDLQTYSIALDWGVMQYHKDMMIEINNILRKYWKNIYNGNDFDYIKIKAEEMKSHSLSRRSYNYRLVYVRRDVEMDMRGHCSAGQRILASLLVRIALAEIFGNNCEFLALDEPTANLDKDTIYNLAESLSELIKDREGDRFQLILITHDEEFAEILTRRCGIDSFYRISRNQNGDSIITEESTLNLM